MPKQCWRLSFQNNGVVRVADDSWWADPFEAEVVPREVAETLAKAFTDHGALVEMSGRLFASDRGSLYVNVPKDIVDSALAKYAEAVANEEQGA